MTSEKKSKSIKNWSKDLAISNKHHPVSYQTRKTYKIQLRVNRANKNYSSKK